MFTGREEQLVEAAMFWNDKKISNLPKYLKARLQKVHARMLTHCVLYNDCTIQTRVNLQKSKEDLLLLQDVGKDLTPEYCEQCQTEVQKIAKRELLLYQP